MNIGIYVYMNIEWILYLDLCLSVSIFVSMYLSPYRLSIWLHYIITDGLHTCFIQQFCPYAVVHEIKCSSSKSCSSFFTKSSTLQTKYKVSIINVTGKVKSLPWVSNTLAFKNDNGGDVFLLVIFKVDMLFIIFDHLFYYVTIYEVYMFLKEWLGKY